MLTDSPSLPMSHIIAPDAPLLSPISPTDSSWESQNPLYSPTNDSFNYNYYYPSPPSSSVSPSLPSRMLKPRMSTDSLSESELCLPTHQVFTVPQLAQAHLPPSPAPSNTSHSHSYPISLPSDRDISSPSLSPLAPSASPAHAMKRSASPLAVVPKKPRSGERISSKDFVPPDVTGLSKREARLVKNRAAAFLSRQRKREEFENMEVRVAELEQENARLLSLTQSGNTSSHPKQPDGELVSEIDQLRAQLAAAQDRERELSAELASKSTSSVASVKVETADAHSSLSSPPRTLSAAPSPHRSGASLGLMVLLCTLPTLLSMPMQNTAPSSFSVSDPLPTSSTYEYNSYLPNEYDWARANGQSMMDLDTERKGRINPTPSTVPTAGRIELTDVDTPALAGLSGLDISFDTSPSEDGKIRVRIHPSSSASSRAESPAAMDLSSRSNIASSPLDIWGLAPDQAKGGSFSTGMSAFSSSSYSLQSPTDDPFFGIGTTTTDYGMLSTTASPVSYSQYSGLSSPMEYGQLPESTFAYGSEFSIPDNSTGGKRRVRVALKSLPVAGGEGGEWEVQIC
ncbi:hypothetical protein AMATHDRAFT_140893 [Amanita thiersii Skay4041]|uniref:BZIP domain-containing protein n=1 Tax=Amanita thiersii Skay4041 TaxID=703135 RepID=A0A2A9NNM5_9AGAR|nr:hypothetical protein AMATHDRAFT_140893 [Amanita thiersii Skay4041]